MQRGMLSVDGCVTTRFGVGAEEEDVSFCRVR
jgi:hypothetical protein